MSDTTPSRPTKKTRHVSEGPWWLRLLVGDRVARRRDIRGLPTTTVLSLVWWRLGLTPTARFRAGRFQQSMLDDRGPKFSVRIARQSAPPGR